MTANSSTFGTKRASAGSAAFFVDLGSNIGSTEWWRGFASLSMMLAVAGWMIASPFELPARAAPATPERLVSIEGVSIAPLSAGGYMGRQVAPTAMVKPLSEVPERPRIELVASLKAVDSFGGALRRAGVSAGDIRVASEQLERYVPIRTLKPGTDFALVLGRRPAKGAPRPLDELSFRAALDLRIEMARNAAGDLVATPRVIRVEDKPLRISGMVGDSLYKSARSAGVSSRVVANFIQAMSPRINFQRNVYASDSFDLVVENRVAETGESETGDLLYARIQGNGKDLEIARWELNGKTEYFLPDGKGIKQGMNSSPIPGARMSSRFGMRRHPILKRTRMHSGLDYAARSGTAIGSTAPGTVIFAGRNGGYGNQVRVQHANGIVTSYSHMSRIDVRRGQSVTQGQRVGAVGSTGLSTGPHLHYEVMVRGRKVDPQSQELPTGIELAGSELRRFQDQLGHLRDIAPERTPAELTQL